MLNSADQGVDAPAIRVEAGKWSLAVFATDDSDAYSERDVSVFANWLATRSVTGVAMLICDLSLRTVSRFLQLLHARVPVLLADSNLPPDLLSSLIRAYRPETLLTPDGAAIPFDGYSQESSGGPGVWTSPSLSAPPHADLAVLLTTSGSTGSPKLVRLSHDNIEANARQIVESLGISHGDRAIASLPLHYSFGMSVVTSHALAGASVVLTRESVVTPGYWKTVRDLDVSFMPGVPQSLAMLRRLRFDAMELPALRVLAQAGGKLPNELVSYFHSAQSSRAGRFHVMYGQTEAGPRISCLPHEDLPAKLGSVGLPMPGGQVRVVDEVGRELGVSSKGEVEYRGPNVMMGYAERRDDLVRGDDFGDVLRTGDLGFLDEDGYLYLVGRSKRIAKLGSARVSLDELEATLHEIAGTPLACIAQELDGVRVFLAGGQEHVGAELRAQFAQRLRVPPHLINVSTLFELPLLSSGKIDYRSLESEDVRGS